MLIRRTNGVCLCLPCHCLVTCDIVMSLFSPISTVAHQLFSPYWQRFFAKRAPHSDSAILSLRNVYIFFSKEGMLYALLLVITFILGVNYGNNLVLGLCFYLGSVWIISLYHTFAHVSGLKIRLHDIQIATVDEPIWITIEVDNDKSKPSRQVQMYFDHSVINQAKTSAHNHEPSVDRLERWGIASKQTLASVQGKSLVRLALIADKRGRLQLPRLVVSSVYPLGIMRAWSYVYFASPAWIAPKPIEFDWQDSKVVSSDEGSDWSVYSKKGQNDFDTLDEYVTGESLARVSWAHVARGQGMLTKQFTDTVGQKLVLDYAHMPAVDHEAKLSMLAYAVKTLGDAGQPFVLKLPNEKPDSELAVGQGDAYVKACLLRLAKLP